MAKKSKVLFPALLMGAKEMLSALKSVAGWAMAHKFLAGVIAGCVLLLSVSQSNRRGEYYFRTADELRYLQDLRQKYSGAKYMLTKEEAEAAIAQACSFLSKCGGGSPAYDTPQARISCLERRLPKADWLRVFRIQKETPSGFFKLNTALIEIF